MTTVDCHDARRVGEFWSSLLGVPLQETDDPEPFGFYCWLEPYGDVGPHILFLETPDTKLHKNRLHFDLRPADQAAEVARALELGATHADIGQGEQTWTVLADVEGNEFCILRALRPDEPGAVEAGSPLRLQAVAVDCHDAKRVAEFWSALMHLAIDSDTSDPDDPEYWLEPYGERGPDLLFLETPDTKLHKNRLHFDLRPDDQAAEVARALELGATHADIGQGEQTWTVLADVEGNEFCILRALREGEVGP